MEILNTIQGNPVYDPTISGYILLFSTITIFIAAWIIDSKMLRFKKLSIVFLCIFLVLLITTAISAIFHIRPFFYIQEYKPNTYQVILTDPNYVIDAQKYQIVKQEGKIITIKDIK